MTLARAAIFLIVALVALLVLVRLFESRLVFFPLRGETTTPRDLGLHYESITIETRDGERLRAWLIPHPTPRAFIVYFHGNGGHLSMWAPILAGVARQGYSVLGVDYRGYGVSTGRPSERGLYRDVEAVLEQVWTVIKPAVPVIYWGRSLGVSMAAYAATRDAPDGMILESGFPDVRSLLRASPPMALLAFFSASRLPAAEHLRGATAPVLVIHGDADSIIPYDQGRALYERISGPKQFFTIRGGEHNDAVPQDARGYWAAIATFVNELPRR